MTESTKIVITACTTLIGGVLIYVSGRVIEKFFIEPVHEYKKTIGNIADNLIYYANIYSNPSVASNESKNETSNALRRLAAELTSRTHSIPFYTIFSAIKVIPKYSNSISASSSLIGLSNSLNETDFNFINEKRSKIEKCLNIKTT